MTPNELLKMPEEDFRAVVDDEVRGVEELDPKTAKALRDPLVADRWYYALVSMKKSVEGQLGAKRSDLLKHRSPPRDRTEYHRWRAGALRFKSGVEERLLEVRSRRHSLTHIDTVQEERNVALAQMQNLKTAITSHKTSVLSDFADDEVSDADRTLWSAIE